MNPLTASVLALLFVCTGGAAVLIMLELTGRARDNSGKPGLIRVHRILGYLFIALFVIMLFFMIRKVAGFQEELTARGVVHIILALALIPLLLTKILIVRRLPQLSEKLPLLGLAIFTFSFALTGITAGYYVLHRTNITYTTLSAHDNNVLNIELGKAIMNKKCSKCHTLERVYRAYKNDDGWARTVNKMALLDAPNITTFDLKQVLNYLVEQQKKRVAENPAGPGNDIGKSLVSRKCSICHNLDRVFGARKNVEQWRATIRRMVTTMDDPEFLSEQEKSDIIAFLSKRETIE